MNGQCDRRRFLRNGLAAGATWAMGRECLAADASAGKARPIENVRVGMVGIGSRGTFLLRLLLEQEGVEVKAVCDLIPQRVTKSMDGYQSRQPF
jgi:predicted homoserine dehydrogenase-like protein